MMMRGRRLSGIAEYEAHESSIAVTGLRVMCIVGLVYLMQIAAGSGSTATADASAIATNSSTALFQGVNPCLCVSGWVGVWVCQ
jgi:hypothetical protein